MNLVRALAMVFVAVVVMLPNVLFAHGSETSFEKEIEGGISI